MSKQQQLKRDFPYQWRVKTRLADRHGQRCRVTARGRMNSVRVEFPDGAKVITSGFFVRRAERREEALQERGRVW